MDGPPRPPCSACGRAWSAEHFYDSSTECRLCKRIRSRDNRLLAARKIALAERFVDTLARLAEQGWRPSAVCCGSSIEDQDLTRRTA